MELLIFLFVMILLLGPKSKNKTTKTEEQKNINNYKKKYDNNPNVLRRSELTDEDIENLKQMEEEDEIVFTSHSIQEAKYYVAIESETYIEQVDFYNNGQIYVDGVKDLYQWRYNEFGIIEVYYPGKRPQQTSYINNFNEYQEDDELEYYLEYAEKELEKEDKRKTIN